MRLRPRLGTKHLAVVVAVTLTSLVGCTATPTSSAPIVAADVAVDAKAHLAIDPAESESAGWVSAEFGTAVKGRPVVLQRQDASAWQDVTTGKLDADGRVRFLVTGGIGEATYRAVAQPIQDQPAAATPEASLKDQWTADLDSEFDGKELEADRWIHRFTDVFEAGGRHCAAPTPENVDLSDGIAELTVSEESDSDRVAKAKAAGCEQKRFFRNAMISTEGLYSIKSGVLATRVKFAEGQGMHGSVWLQSGNHSEIDMIESYGFGRGLTSVIHVDGKRYPADSDDAYIHAFATKDKDWWSKFHIVSVEWDTSQVVVRIDGVEAQRIEKEMPETDYFLVVSMLSSDWEQKRLTDPVTNAEGVTPQKLPQTMEVDWVRTWKPAKDGNG